jgi:hypothetical protein
MGAFHRILVLGLCAVGMGQLGMSGCATKGGPPAEAAGTPGIQVDQVDEAKPGSLLLAQTVTATATVEAIDHATRQVTLRGPEGRKISFRAGEQVRNLDQVQVGDVVQAAYLESFAVQVLRPGQATPGVGAGTAIGRAEPGETPAALGVGKIILTSTIEAIAADRTSVTLKDTDGSLVTVPVRNPANLEGVAVGDLVEITYTEAVAIAVEEQGAR